MVVERRNPQADQSRRIQPWWKRRWRYLHIRLLRLRGKPKAIARGLAIGVFAGFFPLFGLQIIIGVLLAAFLGGNKFAAAVGTWISNPLTYVPIFAFNLKIGKLLLGWHELSLKKIDFQSLSNVMELGSALVLTLFIGCFAVGLVFSFCTYFLALRIILKWRKSRLSKYRHRSRKLFYRKKIVNRNK